MRIAVLASVLLAAAPALADGDGPRRAAPDRGERVIRSFETHGIPADLGPRRRTNVDISVDGRDERRPERRPVRRYRSDVR